jgi:hypothetical protein
VIGERLPAWVRWLSAGVGAAAVMALGWHLADAIGLLIAAPVVAAIVVYPLLEGASAARDALRALALRKVEGRHHAFGGVPLDITHDHGGAWLRAADLQRALRTDEPESVVAARVPGRWRRDDDGTLRLRVDAVVEHLATGPGRLDPRTGRLRKLLQREVLVPAARRAARDRPAAPPRD